MNDYKLTSTAQGWSVMARNGAGAVADAAWVSLADALAT
jgi:hypothetical protein